MRVRVSCTLPAPADLVWRHVQTSRLLRHISFPLIVFASREPGGFPETWPDGPHRVWMWSFGIIPLGPQTVDISRGQEGETHWIRDNGSGFLVKTWDHRIEIAPAGPAETQYTDTVEIKAGLLTPFVWAFAQGFYRWRQHRWQALARGGFCKLAGPPRQG